FLACERSPVATPMKRVLRYVELKMFGHLVLTDDAAGLHADFSRRQRGLGATPDLGLQSAEFFLRGHQQALTLLTPPLAQERVVASDQALAREVGRRDLGQVDHLEPGSRQGSLGEEFTDVVAPQSRNPAQAGILLERVDTGLGKQTTVADQDDPRQAKASPHLADLIRGGARVGRVAGVDVQGDGPAGGVGEQAVDDAREALFAIPVVPILRQGAGVALVGTAADVVEDHRPLAEVLFGQFVLDAPLTPEQPVQGGVGLLVIDLGDAEFLRQGGVLPVACGGQFGAGIQDALHDQGQHYGPLGTGFAGPQFLQAEAATGGENRFDVAVGFAVEGAEVVLTGQEGLALEGATDEVEDRGGQVGKVGEGLVADPTALAVGATQQVTDVGPAVVLPLNLGHVHSR